MIRRDFHVHTVLCDGKALAEEMVAAALKKNMDVLGFSGHAYTSLDETWCMSQEKTEIYRAELGRLKEKYKGQIRLLVGVEQDFYSDGDLSWAEYRIGSSHYVMKNGKLLELDDRAAEQRSIADMYFGGDLMRLAEYYYDQEAELLEKTGADVIGHFNLIEKFNENCCMYDTASPRYRRAWQRAVDRLLESGVPFEINTGAISRGYRTEPYPDREMIKYISESGGAFILSSDSHNTDTLLFGFEELEEYACENGLKLLDMPRLRTVSAGTAESEIIQITGAEFGRRHY